MQRLAMQRLAWALPLLGFLAACDTMEQRQITGTLAGAGLGMAVSGKDDKAQGAVIGGLAGLAAATMLGPNGNGQCIYQYPDGSQVVAACR